MLWFYTRNRDSLRVETRYDTQTLEYVGILTHPDGREDTRRFATAGPSETGSYRWTRVLSASGGCRMDRRMCSRTGGQLEMGRT
jgi:hypothetical protein